MNMHAKSLNEDIPLAKNEFKKIIYILDLV